MKKIFVVVMFLVGIINVSANTLEIKKGGEVIKVNEPYKKDGIEYKFLFSLDKNKIIKDKKYVNNLTFISRNFSSEYYLLTISKMILENVNEDYEVTIKNSLGDEINTSYYKSKILAELNNLDLGLDINGKTYTINWGEDLTVKHNYMNSTYNDFVSSQEIYSDKVVFKNVREVRLNKVNFIYRINKEYNYVVAKGVFNDDFYINVNVLGKVIEFNVSRNRYNLLFNVYDSNNVLVNTINLAPEGTNKFNLPNKDLKIVDCSNNNGYKKLNTIYVKKDDPSYLKYNLALVDDTFKVSITTNFIDEKNPDNLDKALNDFTILDLNYNEIYNCQNEEVCEIEIKRGTYILRDNVTFNHDVLEISSNFNYEIKRHYINGIISKRDIKKIIYKGSEVAFVKNGYMYETKDYLNYDEYTLVFDDYEETINLKNNGKIGLIGYVGVFYVDDDKKIEDKVIIDKEEIVSKINNNSNNKQVENNYSYEEIIPNTDININTINYLYKRKYMFDV